MKPTRRQALATSLILTASGLPSFAWPQAASQAASPQAAARESSPASAKWPQRAVKLLVGFPPGSTPDLSARTIAEPLAAALGQPVIVENRAGASGNIAADLVAKATDDHTLGVVINGNLTSAKELNPKLPFDPAKDFSYLSLLAAAPLLLVAAPGLPGGRAFFEAAIAAGDRWSYGSVGNGSIGHLGVEWLKSRVPGLDAVHVPYQGNPQILTDLAGGRIEFALVPPGLALPQARAGRIRTIGLTSAGRSPVAPDQVPLSEFGVRDFDLEVWNALIGPARLSPQARRRVVEATTTLLRDGDVRRRMIDQGWQVVGSTPEGMHRRVAEEARVLAQIIRSRGITLN